MGNIITQSGQTKQYYSVDQNTVISDDSISMRGDPYMDIDTARGLVFDVKCIDTTVVDGKAAVIKFVFKFNGRTKGCQYGTGTYFVCDRSVGFMVLVDKKSGPVRRVMKECKQKQFIMRDLKYTIERQIRKNIFTPEGELPEYLIENKSETEPRTVREYKVVQIPEGTKFVINNVKPVPSPVSEDPLEIPEFLRRA